MVGGERTRAYRYGITLVCVGALFNWLGYTEQNSDPVRFIGYTCLASGALLLCMAICFWANSSQRSRVNQATPDQALDFSVVSIVDPTSDRRFRREKPPDYSTVADMTPPPCYDEAIKLSPVFLQTLQTTSSTPDPTAEGQRPTENPSSIGDTVSTSPPPSTPIQQQSDPESTPKSVTPVENSTLSKVIRLSSRLLRRTLSNVDCGDQQAATSHGPEIVRSQSAQNVKDV